MVSAVSLKSPAAYMNKIIDITEKYDNISVKKQTPRPKPRPGPKSAQIHRAELRDHWKSSRKRFRERQWDRDEKMGPPNLECDWEVVAFRKRSVQPLAILKARKLIDKLKKELKGAKNKPLKKKMRNELRKAHKKLKDAKESV